MTLDLLETYLFLSWFIFWVIESINFDIRLFAKAKKTIRSLVSRALIFTVL